MLFSRFFAVTALAVGAAALAPTSAHAQSNSYCGGKLVADSFYSTVTSNGSSSDVTYFMQLRNTTSAQVQYAVTFNATQSKARAAGAWMTMSPNGSNKIRLGVDTYNNPSGKGHLDERYDLPPATKVTCK